MRVSDLPNIEPAPRRGRQTLPTATAFLALALFALWGLGWGAWPLALTFGAGAGALVWLLTVLTDRVTRKAAALFLAGLRDGGVVVRAARCQADWFGNTKRVEFDTPLGRGWVRGDSRAVEWFDPSAPVGTQARYARLWHYSPHGPTVGRFTLDDWRVCMRRAGEQEGRRMMEAARKPRAGGEGRQGFPPRPR
jgi:hypothetical protein